ncbi:hypothetical protein [Enterococcus avium]|uniref:hypothetical protein n=1 Tax=Enterococcus avium TaxID=33945 RepID=UPI001F5A5F5C|nr:hypothetical protein [Enterococcus avium]
MNGCDLKFVKSRAEPERMNLLDLPALKLVTTGLTNTLFAEKLTTGNAEKDKQLNTILYSVNRSGKTGIDSVKDIYLNSKLYGRGLLVFNPIDEQMYPVSPFRYQPYYFKENNLVKYTVMYQIYDEETSYIYQDAIKVTNRFENLVTEQTNQGFFISEKLCVEFVEELNPLNTDRKRAEIVLTMLNEILNDLRTGGYGYVVVYGDQAGYISRDEELSDAELFDRTSYERVINDRKTEVREMLDDICLGARKGGYYFDGWAKKIDQLKRVATPKDYWLFMEKAQQITCEILGIPPVLLGLNETSRNVSVESLIEQSNKEFAKPERQKIENYVTKILKPALEVEKIYFEEPKEISVDPVPNTQS